MKKQLLTYSALLCSSIVALSSCSLFGGKKNAAKDEYSGDRLILNLRNLYFEQWTGSDTYTSTLNEKFKVDIRPTSYDYTSWDQQVSGQVQGGSLGDVFHFDLESFNFGNTYAQWAKGLIKALPTDLSKWPNIKNLIDHTSNIDSLKIDGKIYGIPIAYNPKNPEKTFSSFTYVYRRDWVKEIDRRCAAGTMNVDGYPLFRENDVYTWEEFNNVVNGLAQFVDSQTAVIGDASWGFPSLTNFYKDSPHCYSVDSNGKVRNAFTTDSYIKGLDKTRTFIAQNKYFDQVSNEKDQNAAIDQFRGGKIAIVYENFSYANYFKMRNKIKENQAKNPNFTEQDLDDRTAFMKVKNEDGNFCLEGSENWYSMTFFNAQISDNKMNKILDILEYLLTDEGTRFATFGKEGRDYTYNDGEIELIEENWPKTSTGKYSEKENGAKFLRNMITLGHDTIAVDPFTDQKCYQLINSWQGEMQVAKNNGKLNIFMEPGNVKWLSTTLKDRNTSGLIKEGNKFAMNYCNAITGYETKDKYKAAFNTAKWTDTINEINSALGK